MASSLGGAIGAAISLAVFTAMAGAGGQFVGNVVTMEGAQSNTGLRAAGMIALGVNLIFLLLAITSIVMTVPKGGGSRDVGAVAPAPEPAPQLPPDAAKEAIMARLGNLSLSDLEALEKQVLLNEIAQLPEGVLKQLVETRRS